MFKTVLTLFRGQTVRIGEAVADQNALVILDQQVRDSIASLDRAKRALALAIAQDQQEAGRLADSERRIADLELRVSAAIDGANEALAREGAEAIAALEAERDACKTARALFAAEISRLRSHVAQAEGRIAAVERGRRIARAAEAVRTMRKGRIEPALPYAATLSEAESTLKRLQERQFEAQAAEDALDQLDSACRPVAVAEKLAEQGFGPRLKSTADDVLARLRARQTPAL